MLERKITRSSSNPSAGSSENFPRCQHHFLSRSCNDKSLIGLFVYFLRSLCFLFYHTCTSSIRSAYVCLAMDTHTTRHDERLFNRFELFTLHSLLAHPTWMTCTSNNEYASDSSQFLTITRTRLKYSDLCVGRPIDSNRMTVEQLVSPLATVLYDEASLCCEFLSRRRHRCLHLQDKQSQRKQSWSLFSSSSRT